MNLLRYPLRAAGGLMDRLSAVVGAVALSQVPGFVTHYVQRLGGHAAEAARNVAQWQQIADQTMGGNLEALVAQYRTGGALEVVEAGNKCAGDIERLTALREALQSINGASVWTKLPAFLRHLDPEIARATLANYVPNIPLDVESLAYALIGLILGTVLYKGIAGGSLRTLSGIRRTARRALSFRRRPHLPPPAAPPSQMAPRNPPHAGAATDPTAEAEAGPRAAQCRRA